MNSMLSFIFVDNRFISTTGFSFIVSLAWEDLLNRTKLRQSNRFIGTSFIKGVDGCSTVISHRHNRNERNDQFSFSDASVPTSAVSGHNKQDGACSRMKRMCFSCSGLSGSTRYFIAVKPLYIATIHTTLESRICLRYAWISICLIRSHRTQNMTSPRGHSPSNKTGVLLAINLLGHFQCLN